MAPGDPQIATATLASPDRSGSALRRLFVALNVLGGIAVLGSYAHGILTHPDPGAAWGGVPEGLRGFYGVSMLCAAAGYFLMTGYVLYGLDTARTQIGPFGWGLFPLLYALILFPSALWMPLTFAYLAAPSPGLWLAVRGVLFLVGVGSVGVLLALLAVRPGASRFAWALAVAGAAAFVLQTAVLDALVWPAYFPV